jgi:hypothetical protein
MHGRHAHKSVSALQALGTGDKISIKKRVKSRPIAGEG